MGLNGQDLEKMGNVQQLPNGNFPKAQKHHIKLLFNRLRKIIQSNSIVLLDRPGARSESVPSISDFFAMMKKDTTSHTHTYRI